MKTSFAYAALLALLAVPGCRAAETPKAADKTAAPSAAPARGFLRTQGAKIVDDAGRPVRLRGVNWFGLESANFAPHGLWSRSLAEMMAQMKALGFNAVRLPFSNQLFDADSRPNSIDWNKNPQLRGLNGVQIIDKVVECAAQNGLRVLLVRHRSAAGNGPNESGLWANEKYPEARWIADWQMLARRYAENPTVIGADLCNEPHGAATWGDGNPATDWRLAAERAGNAILKVNPRWLIVVEGVEKTPSGSYWWGGNLSRAGQFPVRLAVPGRLVYSPHDYPQSVFNQKWFAAADYPQNLPALWDENWGYLAKEQRAPVLMGEFGTKLQNRSDEKWLAALVSYWRSWDADAVQWMWWSWNPNSGDTGGILQDDWQTPHKNKLALLAPLLNPASAALPVASTPPKAKPLAAPLTTSTGAPTGALAVQFKIRDDWGEGFVADVTLTNNGARPLDGWSVAFDLPARITSVWNGALSKDAAPPHYVIANAPYNATLAPGASVTFGLQGTPGRVKAPTKFEVRGR